MLIGGKRFFDMPIKNDEETYKHTIGLSKQIELEKSDLKQQINFIDRLKRNEEAAMFFVIEKSEERTFEFSQDATTII